MCPSVGRQRVVANVTVAWELFFSETFSTSKEHFQQIKKILTNSREEIANLNVWTKISFRHHFMVFLECLTSKMFLEANFYPSVHIHFCKLRHFYLNSYLFGAFFSSKFDYILQLTLHVSHGESVTYIDGSCAVVV